jgi:hypothetical protein
MADEWVNQLPENVIKKETEAGSAFPGDLM